MNKHEEAALTFISLVGLALASAEITRHDRDFCVVLSFATMQLLFHVIVWPNN